MGYEVIKAVEVFGRRSAGEVLLSRLILCFGCLVLMWSMAEGLLGCAVSEGG